MFGTSCANIERPHFVWGPAESEPFPSAPIHSTKVSKLSLPQSGAYVEDGVVKSGGAEMKCMN
ncbi:hypothetical protein SAMN05421677_11433 [Halobacillus aidingensis]|uniref:Uncharacterized protein n=1 Tax=Halobacillus aidingensis TaxID=240303 RepID=A0A1H0R0K1_HALAD|nr:hypothetical protein SAMN05421677_11433 [Halobacillus aidingensis]